MATIVDEYLDGQSTEGEDVFPCKGCGDVRSDPVSTGLDSTLTIAIDTGGRKSFRTW